MVVICRAEERGVKPRGCTGQVRLDMRGGEDEMVDIWQCARIG